RRLSITGGQTKYAYERQQEGVRKQLHQYLVRRDNLYRKSEPFDQVTMLDKRTGSAVDRQREKHPGNVSRAETIDVRGITERNLQGERENYGEDEKWKKRRQERPHP